MIKLFLLKSGFVDPKLSISQSYYCPHCAMVQGILHYYPELYDTIDVNLIDFQRPREEIIHYLGEENQGCPNLVISKEKAKTLKADLSDFEEYGDYIFVNNKYKIANFLAAEYGIGLWHP